MCEVWAATDGGGGTQRDSWLESRTVVTVDKALSSPDKRIDGDYYLVCIKDGVAYVRHDSGGERLRHIFETDSINDCAYATYGAQLYRVIKAQFGEERVDAVAKRVFEKYKKAFEELAK